MSAFRRKKKPTDAAYAGDDNHVCLLCAAATDQAPRRRSRATSAEITSSWMSVANGNLQAAPWRCSHSRLALGGGRKKELIIDQPMSLSSVVSIGQGTSSEGPGKALLDR
jgi:hypothetical protein